MGVVFATKISFQVTLFSFTFVWRSVGRTVNSSSLSLKQTYIEYMCAYIGLNYLWQYVLSFAKGVMGTCQAP